MSVTRPIPRSATRRTNPARWVGLAAVALGLLVGGTTAPAGATTPIHRPSTTVILWGEGVRAETPSPAEGVSAIATSHWSTLVLGSDGRVKQSYSWASYGGTHIPEDLRDATDIAVSGNHALALHPDGTVTGWSMAAPWGGQAPAPPADLDQVTAIAVGEGHGLALRSDSTLVTWGYAPMTAVPSGLDDVIAIDAAHAHNLALRSDGTVVGWGVNYAGQLDVPPGLRDVVAISAGEYHSLALKSDGTVVAWGNNNWGQGAVPAGLSDVVAIDAGVHHNLALRADGTVVAWGMNGLEDIDGYRGALNVPAGLTGVTQLVAGPGASYAFVEDVDTTAPTLTAVPDVTAEATGPDGASVAYPLPTASDETDGVVPVTCDPAPGATFPIGSTPVTCRASDAAGNTTTGSFSVTVTGAGPQLADLRRAVHGVGPGVSLSSTVEAAQVAYSDSRAHLAIAALKAFVHQVRAHQGRRIPSDQATSLIDDAYQIQSVLGS
jgi:hypothetical protein